MEVMKIMSFKMSHDTLLHVMPPTLQQAIADPCLHPGHSRASLGQSLVGSLFFLLGPGAHKVLFVPSKSLFPQSFVSSGGSMVGQW